MVFQSIKRLLIVYQDIKAALFAGGVYFAQYIRLLAELFA